jgi:hypothetical protein
VAAVLLNLVPPDNRETVELFRACLAEAEAGRMRHAVVGFTNDHGDEESLVSGLYHDPRHVRRFAVDLLVKHTLAEGRG